MYEIRPGSYAVYVTNDMECITEGELVHCWECKYFMPYKDSRRGGGVSHGHCGLLRQSAYERLVVHASKDFCSRGWKRKEEDGQEIL